MNQKQTIKWKNTRQKGKLRFILLTGVLGYGAPMFILMSFIVNKPFANGFTFLNLSLHLSIWFFAGALFGLIMWHFMERAYKESASTQSETHQDK